LIDTSGNITTIAGTGTRGYSGDYGPATSAQLFFPTGLALDSAGNLYIADYGNTTVRKITPAGVITTVAGIGVAGFAAYLGSDGGPATSAVLGLPYSVAVDPTGNLYIADIGSGSIRKVGLDGNINNIVTGVAGAGLVSDSQGNIYYADFRAGTVNRLTPSGVVTDFAGNGLRGFRGDGGASQFSEFDGAYSAAFDSAGNFYVADFGNDAIRLLSPLPSSTLLVANGASNVANQGIAPGEVVTLSGINLGPSSYSSATADANGIFEGQLNGTTVTFNGIAAPMLVASPTQIVAIAPYEISGLSSATVAVQYNGVQLLSTTVAVTDAEPEIFTSGSSGISLPPLNDDGSINSQTNAAAEASTITFFVTGEGLLNPATPDGQVTVSGAAPVPVEGVSVLMNGATATVVSATEAVGLPAGVLVVSATIPTPITTTSAMSVVVTVGSHTSLPAYVAVQ
jgi:uncharacterized protein (TIGR03437 family)